MLGLQLLVSGGIPTTLLGASGFFAGLLYRLDVLGIKRLKVERESSFILPLSVVVLAVDV
jgi:hypothetical protein